jgi:hypothetical protein
MMRRCSAGVHLIGMAIVIAAAARWDGVALLLLLPSEERALLACLAGVTARWRARTVLDDDGESSHRRHRARMGSCKGHTRAELCCAVSSS